MRITLGWETVVAVVSLAMLGFGLLVAYDGLQEIRTAPATDGLACSTGVGETSCIVTISVASAYEGTDEMTVEETSPSSVDRTATSTLSGTSVTVGGLSGSTAYEFTINYRRVTAGLPVELNVAMGSLVQWLLAMALAGLVLWAVLPGFNRS